MTTEGLSREDIKKREAENRVMNGFKDLEKKIHELENEVKEFRDKYAVKGPAGEFADGMYIAEYPGIGRCLARCMVGRWTRIGTRNDASFYSEELAPTKVLRWICDLYLVTREETHDRVWMTNSNRNVDNFVTGRTDRREVEAKVADSHCPECRMPLMAKPGENKARCVNKHEFMFDEDGKIYAPVYQEHKISSRGAHEFKTETEMRVYYQDIVYRLCALLDTTEKRMVVDDVVDSVRKLLDEIHTRNRNPCAVKSEEPTKVHLDKSTWNVFFRELPQGFKYQTQVSSMGDANARILVLNTPGGHTLWIMDDAEEKPVDYFFTGFKKSQGNVKRMGQICRKEKTRADRRAPMVNVIVEPCIGDGSGLPGNGSDEEMGKFCSMIKFDPRE